RTCPTRSCRSRRKTAGTCPIASPPKKVYPSGTPPAPTSSLPSKSQKSYIKPKVAAASSPSLATAAIAIFRPSSGKNATSGEPMSSPWTEGHVKIPESVLSVIEAAGVAAYARNEEACGYLEGPAADPLGVDRAVEL